MYETNFRIYVVNNCNLSSVREVASKKIKTCTFKTGLSSAVQCKANIY